MKKKKGFTLVELIAVIAILAIILTIGGISIVNVRNNILEKDYDNLITTIKIAAESYHDETGIDIVPVNILLQTGKLQADSTDYENLDEGIHRGDPVIFNPIDGTPFNCAAVIFENGKITDIDLQKGCSTEALSANALVVYYQVNDGSLDVVPTNNSDWIGLSSINDKLTLSVPSELKGATWISSKAPDVSYDGNSIEVSIPESGKIQETYTVSGKINGKYVSNEFELRVDAKDPLIEKYYVSEGTTWKNKKHIYADVFDNESQIKDYLIVKGTADCTNSSAFTTYPGVTLPTIFKEINENGKYTICARDNANHITSKKGVVDVSGIDTLAPKLSINVTDGTSWKKSNSFTITLEDLNSAENGTPSGFSSSETVTIKYTWSATTLTSCSDIPNTSKVTFNLTNNIVYTSNPVTISEKTGQGKVYACITNDIKDKAGNALTEKFVSADMYLDNTVPSGSISITRNSSYSYNSKVASYSIKSLSDNHSGLSTMCISENSNVNNCTNWISASNKSNISYTFNATEGSGETKTLYLFVKDAVGNILQTSGNYQLYTSCTSVSYTDSSTGGCSKECGGGSKYANAYDKYLGERCSSEDGYYGNTCNTRDCCSSTTEKEDKHYCSADCDGGNYWVDYYSEYDGSYCGGDYDGGRCNTQSCCDSSYSDKINATRYVDCDEVYITSCQPTCNYNAKCNNGSYYRDDLRTSQPSGCVDYCAEFDRASFNTWGPVTASGVAVWYTTIQSGSNAHTCTNSNCKVGSTATFYTPLCSSGCMGYTGYSRSQINSIFGCNLSGWSWCSCPS